MGPDPQRRQREVRLDFRSGGWVILLSLLIAAALVLWRVVPSVRQGQTPYGTGRADLPYNGFDLSTCLVPREWIATGMPRDTLLPLDNPSVVPAGQIGAINKQYRKYLLPADRVIGVVVAGQSRAYPLRVLDWHEVCNDTLGGEPIAVTYSPLCDSAVVFGRQVRGREVHFGVSGLLYNSNLVMYDTPTAGEVASLWSQLRFGAIAGPAAAEGTALTVLPSQVVYWSDWQRRYPQTTVVAPDAANIERHNREPYSSYYGRGRPRYPVQGLPTDGTVALFEPVVAVEVGNETCVYPFSMIAAKADAQGEWTTTCAGRTVRVVYRQVRPHPATVWVSGEGGDASARFVQAFWFAWQGSRDGIPDHLHTVPPG